MTIAAIAKESANTARAELIAAIWKNADARQLLTLSSAAGLSPEDTDEAARLIEGIRASEAIGLRASALEAAATKARTAYERKRGELQSQIDRIESAIGELASGVEDAERQASQADDARRKVIRGYHDGLVPASHPLVQEHLAHQKKELAAVDAEKALRNRAAAALSALNHNISMLRLWRDRKNALLSAGVKEQSEGRDTWSLSRCKEEISKGPDAISAARKELASAITAARKAGLVVPDAPSVEQDEV